MRMPSRTTRPIASAHVICGASENATTPLMPRPAASATGKRPKMPIAIVTRPATSAVAAVTCAIEVTMLEPPMKAPVESFAVPMISGLRMTM